MDLEKARFNMIEQQVRPWEVLSPQVLELLAQVRREDFVPLAHRALAYAELEIPLGPKAGQAMLAPKVQARLLQDLALAPGSLVLEIGCGTGYMSALLAHLVGPTGRVIALELDPALAEQARQNLAHAGLDGQVQVRLADGSQGSPGDAPFDAIVLGGSVAEVPQALLAQLRVGGRLAAIVGQEPVMRATIITRDGERSYSSQQPWDAQAPRLLGFAEPSSFHF